MVGENVEISLSQTARNALKMSTTKEKILKFPRRKWLKMPNMTCENFKMSLSQIVQK